MIFYSPDGPLNNSCSSRKCLLPEIIKANDPPNRQPIAGLDPNIHTRNLNQNVPNGDSTNLTRRPPKKTKKSRHFANSMDRDVTPVRECGDTALPNLVDNMEGDDCMVYNNDATTEQSNISYKRLPQKLARRTFKLNDSNNGDFPNSYVRNLPQKSSDTLTLPSIGINNGNAISRPSMMPKRIPSATVNGNGNLALASNLSAGAAMNDSGSGSPRCRGLQLPRHRFYLKIAFYLIIYNILIRFMSSY